MKKKKIIIGIIVSIVLIGLFIIIYNSNRKIIHNHNEADETNIKKLEEECEIYLYYENGNQYSNIESSGRYALINIKEHKLYI